MRPLTQNQINLLPEVKDKAPKNKKGEILKRLIDGYLGGEKLERGDLDIIKIAVQLHQTNEKKKRLQAKQRQKDYKEIKAENAKKTREKIILGACDVVALKNGGYPFLNFLMAWRSGYVSDTDLKFMGERYKIQHGRAKDNFKIWRISVDDIVYYLGDLFSEKDNIFKLAYYIYDEKAKKTIKSLVIKRYDHDPRVSIDYVERDD